LTGWRSREAGPATLSAAIGQMNILVVAFRLHDATQQQVSRALHHLEKATLSRDESAAAAR
jgi:hypothetical protein